MMPNLLHTVRQKLLGVILFTTSTALIIALGAFVAYNLRIYREALISDMTTQADLLGHMTAPALTFDDKQLAMQNLSFFQTRSTVRAAAIYKASGNLFATYEAKGEKDVFPKPPVKDAIFIEGENLTLFKRIFNDGEFVGTVYLRADYALANRVFDYLGIAAVVMIVAMAIALVFSIRMQRAVTQPILSIAGIAREVVEQRNYSRRAEKTSDDEVGMLVESFNDMLAEIERRTRELENSNLEIAREVRERGLAQQEVMRLNTELETRVLERTAQLEEANQELAQAKAVAEKANQAKSAFLSSMSHELRTPLNAILGFTQLLASETMTLTPEKRQEFTAHILKAGKHLLVLINEVLDLAKVESGTLTLSLEPVLLSDIMAECREMIQPLANGRNIRLVFPQDEKSHVVADRTRLKQIVLNLLSNAVKYNRDGGTVIIGCSPTDSERVRISVQDTGAGLNADQVEHLFQPFNRLGQEAGAEEGTGIGLVVTKRLVEMMSGNIGVTSTVGVGSTFWIELKSTNGVQYVAADSNAKRITHSNGNGSDTTKRTLLYVEDNPANLKLVQEIIAFRTDLRLLMAADGSLGIELARAHQPAVILMDINLPGMSGSQALQTLRKDPATSHIPVIALSANAMPHDVKKGLAAGFFRYLTKPIDIEEFLAALDSALESADSAHGGDENSKELP